MCARGSPGSVPPCLQMPTVERLGERTIARERYERISFKLDINVSF